MFKESVALKSLDLTTLLLAALVLVFIYIAHRLQEHFGYWDNQKIACDPAKWLLGNLTGLMTTKTFDQIIRDYYEKYKDTGPFAGFYWFIKPAVFILDKELVKLILIKDFSKFADRGFYCNEEDDPLTGQLFTLDGSKWRQMRNKLSPTFTSGKMKIMFPLVLKLGHDLVETFHKTLATTDEVEVRDLAARFTTDVIGSCAFGFEINSLKNPNVEFRKMSRKALTVRRYGILGFVIRFSMPQLARRLHVKDTMADVEKFFLGIVKETIEYRERNNIRRNDFMDMLIDLKNNKVIKSESGEDLTNLTFGEIAAQAFVFLLAGFETSSTTMGFALYEMAQHPELQQKARDEVCHVLEAHKEFTYECLKDMVYLEQIIQGKFIYYYITDIRIIGLLTKYDNWWRAAVYTVKS